MLTSLVTGGAGFIGSHVAQHLTQRSHKVVVLDDLSGGFENNLPAKCIFVEGSILDTELIDHLFRMYKFTYVYHLAAYAAEGLSHFIKRFNYHNNLIGSVNLINASINYAVERFIFTSSIAVYGTGQSPLTEEMTPVPKDSYGIAKLAVEQELKASNELFGLDYVVFRPHNVYGERQNIGDRYRNVIGIFMNQLLRGEAMTIFGDGSQQRAFTHIDDVAPVIASSVEYSSARNQIINIGADGPCALNELAHLVAAAMGRECRIKYLEPRYEVNVAFCDHSKGQRIFGAHKSTCLEKGLSRMADWVAAQGVREAKVFKNIEVVKNLPPAWAIGANV
jgi:UDP-glucose 4-epimerase